MINQNRPVICRWAVFKLLKLTQKTQNDRLRVRSFYASYRIAVCFLFSSLHNIFVQELPL